MSGLVNDGMDKGSMMDSEDRIEKTVDIYITAEAVRDMKHKKDTEDFNTQTAKTQTPQHTGSDSVRNRSSRAAAVCLVLLCVLLLTAVIVLCVHIHTKSTNYTEERDQLLTKINNLTEEKDQLLTNNTNLTEERDGLRIKNKNLTNERDQLRNELFILAGWTYYKSSLYNMSNERKSWTESRRYCRERGADLIIINNKEEQDFVKNMTGSDLVWIGLTDSDVEGTWRWVDGSTLTSEFWAPGEPNGSKQSKDEDCALTQSSGGADYPCDYEARWICEKTIF